MNRNFDFFCLIETLSDAQRVGRQGTWAACILAGMTGIFALASILGVLPKGLLISGWGLVDAALFGIIAWGIYRMSRVAAVAGLVFYIVEQVIAIATSDTKKGFGIVAILMIMAFFNAVRGTFAYHRLRKSDRSAL
jgi:hypothetical protein